jgi:hypothetical protein
MLMVGDPGIFVLLEGDVGVGKVTGGSFDGEDCFPGVEGVAVGPVEAGISSQSSPAITFVFKKNGHSSQSMARLSIASAA